MSLDAGERVNQTIYIHSGIYNEQIYIPTLRGRLTIYGETDESVSSCHEIIPSDDGRAFSYSANTVTIIDTDRSTDSGGKAGV